MNRLHHYFYNFQIYLNYFFKRYIQLFETESCLRLNVIAGFSFHAAWLAQNILFFMVILVRSER